MSGAKITTSLLGRLIAFAPLPGTGSHAHIQAGRVGRIVSVYTSQGTSVVDVEFANGDCLSAWSTGAISSGVAQLVPQGSDEQVIATLVHSTGYSQIGIAPKLRTALKRAGDNWRKSFADALVVEWRVVVLDCDTLDVEQLSHGTSQNGIKPAEVADVLARLTPGTNEWSEE